MDQERPADLSRLGAEEEDRWETCGRQLAGQFRDRRWGGLNFDERVTYLEAVLRRLRPEFELMWDIELTVVESIDGDPTGMAYDDETGKVILVVSDEVRDRESPVALVAGLAHELRHAYQHEVREGLHPDEPRADLWRDAYRSCDASADGYEDHPLKLDTKAAETAVGFGFTQGD